MYIASAATLVKLHEFPSGKIIFNYTPRGKTAGEVRSISWSKDGKWLALVPHSGFAEIITTKNDSRPMHIIHSVEEPSCISFQNTTKKYVALGTKNGLVLVYDVKTSSVKKRFQRIPSVITHVTFSATDTHLTAATAKGDIHIYSNVTNNLACTYKVPLSASVSTLRNNGTKKNLFVAGSNEGIIAVWDAFVNKHKFYSKAHNAPVTSAVFSPINPDLILSTGLDRQFCLHDSAMKESIISIPVGNNITSADFTSDGANFILASQNGKIHIYDSRKILKPLSTFEAHKTSVKHLLFQKSGNDEESTINDLSLQTNKRLSSGGTVKMPSDSFGLLLDGNLNSVEDRKSPSIHVSQGTDSFMSAMGFEESSVSSIKAEKDLKTSESSDSCADSKSCIHDQSSIETTGTPVSLHPQNTMLLCQSESKPFSTPKDSIQGTLSDLSPIVSSSQTLVNSIKIDELMSIMKNEVRNLVKASTEDIKSQMWDVASQLKRVELDMTMIMVKEILRLENKLEGLRADINAELSSSDCVLEEENVNLKMRIAELEEQLRHYKNHQNGVP